MKKSYLILLVLVLLGAFLNYLPHLNYPYPLHVDEWTHFTNSQHLSDNTPLYFGGESESLEKGFHILLATLKTFGIDYFTQFQFLASFFTILISLALFIAVRKYFNENTALFSVFFFIFIESSASFLGPMFLIPLSVGMLMIPIALYLVETNFLFLIVASTLIIHPPSGIALLFLVGSYWVFNRNKKIIWNSLLGVLLSLPLFFGDLAESGLSNLQFREAFIPPIFILRSLGVVLSLSVLVGYFLSAKKKKYWLFLYSGILLSLMMLSYKFNTDILIFYERNVMYLLEIFAIPFGVFLAFFAEKFRSFKKISVPLLFVLLLLIAVPPKIESTTKMYHIVNETEINNYLAYKNVEGERAVIHPWKAIAFTPLAQKEVYSRIPPGPIPEYLKRNEEIFEFFNQSCSNKSFLEENEIDIVVGDC